MAIDRDSVNVSIDHLYDLNLADIYLDPDVARNMADAINYAADCLDGKVNSWEEWEELHMRRIEERYRSRVRPF